MNLWILRADNDSPFSIDEATGIIRVAETLDAADPRSRGGLYILPVTVRMFFVILKKVLRVERS